MPCDYGDSPDPSYNTTLGSNGARHGIDGITFLGSCVDSEPDGLQDPMAFGDDVNNSSPGCTNDEDGIVMTWPWYVGGIAQITVYANVDGYLNAWADFNRNGSWAEQSDQIFNNLFLQPGYTNLNIPIPPAGVSSVGLSFARFRFTSNLLTGLSYTGIAPDGEVEDYMIDISNSYPCPIVYAGTDATICEDGSYILADATASDYQLLQWYTMDGAGFFSDETILNPVYFPSPLDYLSGCIHLGVIATPIAPCTVAVYDEMKLCFLASPQADAGEDATICEGNAFVISSATASNYAILQWYTMDGAGVFSDETIQNPTYYPSPLDVASGCIHLGIIATAIDPCTVAAYDEMKLCFPQIIEIQNGWSGISSYIEPINPNVEVMFSSIISKLVILYNFTGIYYPSGSTNTIGEWDVYSGYVIKVSEKTDLYICGDEVENKTVNLNPGWSLIPVLSSTPFNIESLFTGVGGFVVAKDVAGVGIYWKNYGINTIGNVLPGKAYYVRMNAPGIIDYSQPDNKSASGKPANIQPLLTPWNDVVSIPASHLVAFNVGCNIFQIGDIVGGFTADGKCTGAVEITDPSTPFAISLNGDDPYSSEKEGFESGELINYKLYRPITGETFNLAVTYNPEMNSGYFENNGLSEVTLVKMSITGISNPVTNNFKIYPNPTDGTFTIEGIHEKIKAKIFNAFGEEIYFRELNLPAKVDLSAQPNGMYFIRIETSDNVFFKKLVIN
jgi:hypothetical protein